jgi:hypothetical protein
MMVTSPQTRRNDVSEPITIRHSTSRDRAAVEELAELDGRPVPAGDTLLAEVKGKLWAAVGVDDGAAVADPFLPTGDVVWLLQIRAEQERAERGRLVRKRPDIGRFRTTELFAQSARPKPALIARRSARGPIA